MHAIYIYILCPELGIRDYYSRLGKGVGLLQTEYKGSKKA